MINNFPKNDKSPKVRVIHLILTLVSIILFLFPIIIRDFYPYNWIAFVSKDINILIYYIVVFGSLYLSLSFIEKKLQKSEWYQKSFFMKEVGKKDSKS